jgi:hypothetical protein
MVHHAAIMAPGMPINTGTGSATIRLDSTATVTRHSGAIEAAQSTPRNGLGTWVGQAVVDLDVVWAKLAAMAEGARLATNQSTVRNEPRARIGSEKSTVRRKPRLFLSTAMPLPDPPTVLAQGRPAR